MTMTQKRQPTSWDLLTVSNIIYKTGDILQSDAYIIVIPVNLVGIMDDEITRRFKKRYPDLYNKYKRMLDTMRIDRVAGVFDNDKFWCFFPTKHNWEDKSKLTHIEVTLKSFKWFVGNGQKVSFKIAMPKIGCITGGLDWEDVKLLIEDIMSKTGHQIEIYI